MRALAPILFLFVSLISCSTVQAITIGESSSPEDACRDLVNEKKDFEECVNTVKAERATHDRFLQDGEAARVNAEREETRRGRARAVCQRAGMELGTVVIGIRSQLARDCGWGIPDSIRRTTTARGRSEQWIYPGPSYLYFENGKLVAIQN